MKESEYSYFGDRMNRNVRLKIFQFFFDVTDGMNLCGRNVAFPVREGMNLTESQRIGKKIRISDFELKTPENRQKKWYTQRKRQGIKLSPKANSFPSGETFLVSPVATFSRILQIYSNGTRWYFIFQSPVPENLCWQAILRYLEK